MTIMRNFTRMGLLAAMVLPLAGCSSDDDNNGKNEDVKSFEELVARQADICGTLLKHEEGGKPVIHLQQGCKWPWLYIPNTSNCGQGGNGGQSTVVLDSVPDGFSREAVASLPQPAVFYGKLVRTGHWGISTTGEAVKVTDAYRLKVDSIGSYAEGNVKVASDVEIRCKVYSGGDGSRPVPEAYMLVPADDSQLPAIVTDHGQAEALIWAYGWPDGTQCEYAKTYVIRGDLYRTKEHLRQTPTSTARSFDYRLDITSAVKSE